MSTQTIPKFGELSIKSSLDDENEHDADTPNGFSTIDLNGTQNDANSTQAMNESDLGYTSFGLALNENSKNAQNQSVFSEPNSPSKSLNSSSMPSTATNANLAAYLTSNLSSTTASSVLNTASEASTIFANKTISTIESFKQWSKTAYKCTKQIVSEKLGKSTRTVDPELEASIENLREVKKKYEHVLGLATTLASSFQNMVQTQKQLGETFSELAQKSSELIDEFTTNSETQRQLVKHGEQLLSGLNVFTSSLRTLCSKTMEDTLLTIRNYEATRLLYDAHRFDLENLRSVPPNEQKMHEIANLEQDVSKFREKYEAIKKDVVIKMKFLDENRVKVMKKQLVLFQSAIGSYFSGNQLALESTIKQLNLKNSQSSSSNLSANPDDGSYKFQSFLEQN